MNRWIRRGRHAWKGACARNLYALLFAPAQERFVRVFWFDPDEYVVLDMDNRVIGHD